MNLFNFERALVISTELPIREKITATVQKCGLSPFSCHKIAEALGLLAQQGFGVVFCNEILPDGDFRAVVAAVKPIPVVVLSRFAEWDRYLAALRAGAFDYIACPPDHAETERIMWAAVKHFSEQHRTAHAAA
jgi:two-component system response regulator PilR (NtrC family)